MTPKRAFAGWGQAVWPWLVLVAAVAAHAQPLLCDYCRRVITGPYLVYEGRNLHERCYYDHYAKYCSICRAPLSGQYLTDSWGDAVCAVHLGEYPSCEYCGRLVAEPLTGHGAHYPDGRNVCGRCESSAVGDIHAAHALLDTAQQELRRRGLEIDRELELVPIDKLRMLDVNSAIGNEAWGYTDFKQTVSFFGLVKSEQITIYVLSRLPRTILLGVLVHELMHVWLYVNAPADMEPSLTEGSCEYAAHLVLQHRSDPYVKFLQEARETSDDLVYGTGFRSVRDYANRVGVAAWLGYLKGHSGPPW